MFSELLFLRFNGVLIQRSEYLIEHMERFHVAGDRRCCVNRADNLHAMFVAINKVHFKLKRSSENDVTEFLEKSFILDTFLLLKP
jgi:hypothetical protein